MTGPVTLVPPSARTGHRDEPRLPITVRLPDGRTIKTELPASRHRSLHLEVIHSSTRGLVEIAAGRRDATGKINMFTRRWPDHFLPGGASGGPNWLEPLLDLVDRHRETGAEVFFGPAPRVLPTARSEHIRWSRWAWVDIDGPEHLGRIDALLVTKPAKLRVYSGGSGGEHIYFPLAEPLPARTLTLHDRRVVVNPSEVWDTLGESKHPHLIGYRDTSTGEVITGRPAVHWIERANMRLIHKLGHTTKNEQTVYVADTKCQNRSRVMRLAGTLHPVSGEYARISYLDLRLAPYLPRVLFGDLEDPTPLFVRRRSEFHRFNAHTDRYRRIPAAVYFPRIAGIELPAYGNISCPSPSHPDVKPSCHASDYVFYCHSSHCGVRGTIYDLESLVEGGPSGDALAAAPREEFLAVKQRVISKFGDL
jgi:hypothetical protein